MKFLSLLIISLIQWTRAAHENSDELILADEETFEEDPVPGDSNYQLDGVDYEENYMNIFLETNMCMIQVLYKFNLTDAAQVSRDIVTQEAWIDTIENGDEEQVKAALGYALSPLTQQAMGVSGDEVIATMSPEVVDWFKDSAFLWIVNNGSIPDYRSNSEKIFPEECPEPELCPACEECEECPEPELCPEIEEPECPVCIEKECEICEACEVCEEPEECEVCEAVDLEEIEETEVEIEEEEEESEEEEEDNDGEPLKKKVRKQKSSKSKNKKKIDEEDQTVEDKWNDWYEEYSEAIAEVRSEVNTASRDASYTNYDIHYNYNAEDYYNYDYSLHEEHFSDVDVYDPSYYYDQFYSNDNANDAYATNDIYYDNAHGENYRFYAEMDNDYYYYDIDNYYTFENGYRDSSQQPVKSSCDIDETLNALGASQCQKNDDCTGYRKCSAFGWCNGESGCE